jgi:hypothetical protein
MGSGHGVTVPLANNMGGGAAAAAAGVGVAGER